MSVYQNKIILFIVTTFLACSLTGCKKVSNWITGKAIKESTEETTEVISRKAYKLSFGDLSEKGLKKLDYDSFILVLKRDFPSFYSSFSKLDKGLQKDILNSIHKSPKLLDILLSSKTLLDEFVVATSKTPIFAKDINFFSHYVRNPQFATNISIKQTSNVVEFFSKTDNSLLGKYENGILNVVGAFGKDGHTFSNQMLRDNLIPNTLYKIKGEVGTLYQFQTDAIGNVITAHGRNITPEDLVSNILRRNTDINLGRTWPDTYKKIKQYSSGADLDASIRFNYSTDNPNPRSVKLLVKRGDKEVVNDIFENANHLIPIKYTSSQNAELLLGFGKKLNIPTNKINTLQNLMDADAGFADFIYSNPEFNIKRWLKTRNHVDESLIIKLKSGRFPPNAKVYSGNVYYFNPYLNPRLANRLSNKNGLAQLKNAGILSREQLEDLDRLYPNGVPFSKSGFPDFSGVAKRGKDGKPIVIDIKVLSGDSKIDIAKAEERFLAQGYEAENGYSWHHIEGTTSLIRVPTIIHQLIDHAGGMAVPKK